MYQSLLKTLINVVKHIINTDISNAEAEQVKALSKYQFTAYQSMREGHISDDGLLSAFKGLGDS